MAQTNANAAYAATRFSFEAKFMGTAPGSALTDVATPEATHRSKVNANGTGLKDRAADHPHYNTVAAKTFPPPVMVKNE
jgi:hypothetical protein